jgi:hypothetical protein
VREGIQRPLRSFLSLEPIFQKCSFFGLESIFMCLYVCLFKSVNFQECQNENQ